MTETTTSSTATEATTTILEAGEAEAGAGAERQAEAAERQAEAAAWEAEAAAWVAWLPRGSPVRRGDRDRSTKIPTPDGRQVPFPLSLSGDCGI